MTKQEAMARLFGEKAPIRHDFWETGRYIFIDKGMVVDNNRQPYRECHCDLDEQDWWPYTPPAVEADNLKELFALHEIHQDDDGQSFWKITNGERDDGSVYIRISNYPFSLPKIKWRDGKDFELTNEVLDWKFRMVKQ